MAHFLQLLHDRFDPAGTNEQDAVSQPADNFLGQFLPGEQLFRQQRILGLNQTNPAVQLDRNPRPWIRSRHIRIDHASPCGL